MFFSILDDQFNWYLVTARARRTFFSLAPNKLKILPMLNSRAEKTNSLDTVCLTLIWLISATITIFSHVDAFDFN